MSEFKYRSGSTLEVEFGTLNYYKFGYDEHVKGLLSLTAFVRTIRMNKDNWYVEEDGNYIKVDRLTAALYEQEYQKENENNNSGK